MKDIRKPVYLLSGFLGSGKTTLLNALLKRDDFSNTLVIVNEFGEVALDHLLVEESSDTVFQLSNGCLCCSVRGELVDTLLAVDTSRFKRVIIETTGIADPLPVFQSLAFHPTLAENFIPASILVVFDVLRGSKLVETHKEAAKQLAVADVVILSKTDMGMAGDAQKTIRNYNPTAMIIDNIASLSPDSIQLLTDKPEAHQHSHEHAKSFKSIVLETKEALDVNSVSGLLHHLTGAIGKDLLRIKGFVKTIEHEEQPVFVQVSGQIVHDFELQEKWPENITDTLLVVITQKTDPRIVISIFDAFMGHLGIDTPDKQAMMDNPLSIPGFKV